MSKPNTAKGTDLEIANYGGVYGIFVDNKPIYIGYTMRKFKERFQEHKNRIEGIENPNLEMYFLFTDYEKQNYTFKILFNVSTVQYRGKRNAGITRQDLKCIEFAFINLFKPKYNKSGNTEPYYFN